MKVAIIGYGHVGKATHHLFNNALLYDVIKRDAGKWATKEEVNNWETHVFVGVV